MVKIKGISPVVAEVVMISLVVMIGMLVVSWTDYFSSSSKEKTDERYKDTVYCSQLILQLDTFMIIKGEGIIKLYVVNKGSQPYPIKKFELYTTNGECVVEKEITLDPGESKLITLDCSSQISFNDCDKFRSFSIISPCIDKSVYLTKKLIDTGKVCKYERSI